MDLNDLVPESDLDLHRYICNVYTSSRCLGHENLYFYGPYSDLIDNKVVDFC